MAVRTGFQPTGPILVRATTHPGDLEPPPDLDLADSASVERDGRTWLAKVWARPEVREAVSLASPALGERLEQMVNDRSGFRSAKELRRAVMSVASYLLRWQRRATPFGLFAGVAPVAVAAARAEFGAAHRAVLRADSEWLELLIERLERHAALRARLTVVVDSARVVRDGRVIVHRRAAVGAAAPGPLRESSVRLTQPVKVVLEAARTPIRFDALAAQVHGRFPTAAQEKIRALLAGLVDAGVLVTGLRAPMTTVDALSHLVDVLRLAGGEELVDIADLVGDLDTISELMHRQNAAGDSVCGTALRMDLGARMSALGSSPGAPLAVDVRLDARVAVPERLLTEAAQAASVLLRMSPQPFGSTAWLDYHARFRARYGPGALVPVRELVADSGLGYPAGYLGAPRARPAWRTLTDRDAALLALIQRATLDGADEIALTDADIDALTVGDHRDIVVPQRIELGVVVHAASAEALDRGDFRLQVTAAPRPPTSMAGRFAPLLDDADRARLAASFDVRGAPDGPLTVQLSFPPRRRHNENVVRVPPLLPHVIRLSEHPDTAHANTDITVDDLAVTADAEQMYLVRRSTGRRIVPRIPHALDTIAQTPPLARFLAEVADARTAVFRGFDHGAARTLPYVPRIRHRRTILAAARWILTRADLDAADSNALHRWRERWRVPTRIVLVDGELRLPLDLDHTLDRALLLHHLARNTRIDLHEDGPPDSHGWIGRPAELLIPMTAAPAQPRPLPVLTPPGAVERPGTSTLVHAQLTGNPARFDDLLTAHIPAFVTDIADLVQRWWIRRHRNLIHPDSDHHLALFLRLTHADHHALVLTKLAAFTGELEDRGLPSALTYASTPQHVGRYGNGPALTAAEEVFAADTHAAIAQINAARACGIPGQAFAAASVVNLAAAFAPDPATGCKALVACLPQQHGPLDRVVRDHTFALAAEPVAPAQGRRLGAAVAAAWAARAAALTTYRKALDQQPHNPAAILRTLVHDHHTRALGTDPTFEKETTRLARAAAQRLLARGATP